MEAIIDSLGGLGPFLSIVGLALDSIGVVLSLWAIITMREKYMKYIATRTDNMAYGPENYVVYKSDTYKSMKLQRRMARIGLVLLLLGFFLQIVGTYIWARA